MVVHFICRGNVNRSLIAETYLKSLELPNITVISSGTITDAVRETDMPFFHNTTRLLISHGLQKYVKPDPEQLTQKRVDGGDVTICMNDVVVSEANNIVTLPKNVVVWDITDFGEGTRTEATENGRQTEEIIYDEIIAKVNELVAILRV